MPDCASCQELRILPEGKKDPLANDPEGQGYIAGGADKNAHMGIAPPPAGVTYYSRWFQPPVGDLPNKPRVPEGRYRVIATYGDLSSMCRPFRTQGFMGMYLSGG